MPMLRWTNLVKPLTREGVSALVPMPGEDLGTMSRVRVHGGQPLAAERLGEPVRNVTTPELWIYDVIDSWGGDWGVSAADVIDALQLIGDVPEISVRINSPGGDYFEGVAIHNALTRLSAKVTVYVDALAASAASVIAMAGDEIVMGPGSQLMIHEASSMAYGTAADFRHAAQMLDQTNDDVAGFYAARSGGDVTEWRQAVAVETWYTASQAVAAGLADRVAERASTFTAAAPASPDLRTTEVSSQEISSPDIMSAVSSPAADSTEPPAALPTAGFTLSELISSALAERQSA